MDNNINLKNLYDVRPTEYEYGANDAKTCARAVVSDLANQIVGAVPFEELPSVKLTITIPDMEKAVWSAPYNQVLTCFHFHLTYPSGVEKYSTFIRQLHHHFLVEGFGEYLNCGELELKPRWHDWNIEDIVFWDCKGQGSYYILWNLPAA